MEHRPQPELKLTAGDIVRVQCLGCGAEIAAHRSGLVRCRQCGGLEFHVVDLASPPVQVGIHSSDTASANEKVIDRLMALVDAVCSGHHVVPH